jgi:hypothetical protein
MAEAFGHYQYSDWVDPINNSLLNSYYMLNIGAVFFGCNSMGNLSDLLVVLNSVVRNVGLVVALLGSI